MSRPSRLSRTTRLGTTSGIALAVEALDAIREETPVEDAEFVVAAVAGYCDRAYAPPTD